MKYWPERATWMKITEEETLLVTGTRAELEHIKKWVDSTRGAAKYTYSGWEDTDPHYMISFHIKTLKAEFILEFG